MKGKDSFKGMPSWQGKGKGDGKNKGGRQFQHFRIRTPAAEAWRRDRWQEKTLGYLQARQDREEICQERQDTVPPLRRDNFRSAQSPRPRSIHPSKTTNTYTDQSIHSCSWIGRQRSETPQGRRTRSRTGYSRGAHWANMGRQQQHYREPPRYQQRARSSGAAWLNQGYQQRYDQQPPREPYKNRHHG